MVKFTEFCNLSAILKRPSYSASLKLKTVCLQIYFFNHFKHPLCVRISFLLDFVNILSKCCPLFHFISKQLFVD